jgi:hypothetical protein
MTPNTGTGRKKKTVATNIDALTSRFGYVLFKKNDPRGRIYDGKTGSPLQDKEYKPRQNLLYRSSIVWDGSDAVFEKKKEDGSYDTNSRLISGHRAGKQIIRYYEGCTSLFEDEQPKDRDVMAQLVEATPERVFADGYLFVYGYEDMLKKYLDICSWNADSDFRIPTVEPVFKALDSEASAESEADRLDKIEEAMELAKKASEKKMMIHCQFLGVETVDLKTLNPLSEKGIRAGYRKAALKDPFEFIRSYNDTSIQLQSYIEKAMQTGLISTTIIPNQAAWSKKGTIICDLSGLKSPDAILNKLVEFAKSDSEQGSAFKEMLTALYE